MVCHRAQKTILQFGLFVDSDARCSLQLGQLADSQRRVTQLFRNQESDASAWRLRGRAVIDESLENEFADAVEQISADKDAIAEQAFQQLQDQIEAAYAQLEELQSELILEIDKWGDEKPVEARYADLVKRKRKQDRQFMTASAATITIGVGLGYWLYGYAKWLVVIPILLCGFFVVLWALNLALIWDSPLGGDPELEEWAEKNNKKI